MKEEKRVPAKTGPMTPMRKKKKNHFVRNFNFLFFCYSIIFHSFQGFKVENCFYSGPLAVEGLEWSDLIQIKDYVPYFDF